MSASIQARPRFPFWAGVIVFINAAYAFMHALDGNWSDAVSSALIAYLFWAWTVDWVQLQWLRACIRGAGGRA